MVLRMLTLPDTAAIVSIRCNERICVTVGMFNRRRCQNFIPLLLLLGGVLLSIVLVKKMKYLYDGNQKYYRLQSYKKYMDEVSSLLNHVARTANKSTETLRQLNSALQVNLESSNLDRAQEAPR